MIVFLKFLLLVAGIIAALFHISIGFKRYISGRPVFKFKHLIAKTRLSETSGLQLIIEGCLFLVSVVVLFLYFYQRSILVPGANIGVRSCITTFIVITIRYYGPTTSPGISWSNLPYNFPSRGNALLKLKGSSLRLTHVAVIKGSSLRLTHVAGLC